MDITSREALVNRVLNQIVKDVESRDLTAIEEMLGSVPWKVLVAYLPEGFEDAEDI